MFSVSISFHNDLKHARFKPMNDQHFLPINNDLSFHLTFQERLYDIYFLLIIHAQMNKPDTFNSISFKNMIIPAYRTGNLQHTTEG